MAVLEAGSRGGVRRKEARRRASVGSALSRSIAALALGLGAWGGVAHFAAPAAAQDRAARSGVATGAISAVAFDPSRLIDSEARLVQAALAWKGCYTALIDGSWGRGSQQALERCAPSSGAGADGPATLVWSDVARIAFDYVTEVVLADEPLAFRHIELSGFSVVAPRGPLQPLEADAANDYMLSAQGVLWFFARDDGEALVERHIMARRLHSAPEPLYGVERDDRIVTRVRIRDMESYVRSEPLPGGGWGSVTVMRTPTGSEAAFNLAISGIDRSPLARIAFGEGTALSRAFSELLGLEEDAPGAVAGAAPPPAAGEVEPGWLVLPPGGASVEGAALPERDGAPVARDHGVSDPGVPNLGVGAPVGTGTAFYVNNTDLVTAAHVVTDCARVERADGRPLEIVALDETRDVALLAAGAAGRSRVWVGIGTEDAVRLGQRVYALGYPFWGLAGTTLNLTAGNVSALAGFDDAEILQISAPVQPGNSGGPLVDRDGVAVGVVVARLKREGFGVGAPENMNYALSGSALRRFLEGEGVVLPSPGPPVGDLEAEGLPDGLGEAVVAILCR